MIFKALKRKHAADLENERARYLALEQRLAGTDDDRNALEAKLAELRKALIASTAALETEKRVSSDLRAEIEVQLKDSPVTLTLTLTLTLFGGSQERYSHQGANDRSSP